MKRFLLTLTVLCSIVAFAAPGWSLTITEVGGVDTLLAETRLSNSSDAAEKAWVESVLGFEVTFETKYDVSGSEWQQIEDHTGIYAHELDTNPQYFLLKTGNVTSDNNRHFLFENIGELSWAVINLADMDFYSITNISGISHIGEYNSQVPEPGTMLLLGSGLLGLGLYRRFRK